MIGIPTNITNKNALNESSKLFFKFIPNMDGINPAKDAANEI